MGGTIYCFLIPNREESALKEMLPIIFLHSPFRQEPSLLSQGYRLVKGTLAETVPLAKFTYNKGKARAHRISSVAGWMEKNVQAAVESIKPRPVRKNQLPPATLAKLKKKLAKSH